MLMIPWTSQKICKYLIDRETANKSNSYNQLEFLGHVIRKQDFKNMCSTGKMQSALEQQQDTGRNILDNRQYMQQYTSKDVAIKTA